MSSVPRRRPFSVVLAAAALAAGALGTVPVAQAAYEDATMSLPRKTGISPGIGPQSPYVQEIPIGGVVPLKDKAIINRTEYGYLLRGGQQNNDMTVSIVDGRLRVSDPATQSWLWLPRPCQEVDVAQGVAASCRIPTRFTLSTPMLLEVWPRLGDDKLDTTALPALVDVSFLGDRGQDVARLGAGDDFVNGAQDNDRAYGGEGNDWLRTGLNDDYLDGGPGKDHLVGVDGSDTIVTGPGADDRAGCGPGFDKATYDSTDRALECEDKDEVLSWAS